VHCRFADRAARALTIVYLSSVDDTGRDNQTASSDTAFVIPSGELRERIDRHDPSLVLVDVLGSDSYQIAHIPGAINVPYATMSEPVVRRALIDPDADIVVYCGGGT
jgi:3-mercaptopyruvate sulfurtransferase SseA